MNRKNILMVYYEFPPISGGGTPRILRLVKNLRNYGWEPILLTVKLKKHHRVDWDLLKSVPEGIEVIRAKSFELKSLYRTFSLPILWHLKIWKFIEWIENKFFIPDPQALWANDGIKKGREIIKNKKIDCIFSSGSPFTTHKIARALANEFKIPWISDFRDGWTLNSVKKEKDNALELSVLKDSYVITAVSKPLVEQFKKILKHDPQKFIVFPNGFDAAEIRNAKTIQKEKFTVSYAGSFYSARTPAPFLDALSLFITKYKIQPDQFQVQFMGTPIENVSFHLKPYIKVRGWLKREEAISELKSSHVQLLIILGKGSSVDYTGKIFEYLGVNKPILSIIEESDIARTLLQRCGEKYIFYPSQTEEIADSLFELFNDWRSNEKTEERKLTQAQIDSRNEYEAQKQTRDFVQILNRIHAN